MKATDALTHGRLRQLLHYDPKSGIFSWLAQDHNQLRTGHRAGWAYGTGYRRIKIDGGYYLEHRLAFLWMTGVFPSADVDHINGDRADNRWANLRPATRRENTGNTKLGNRNTSGFKGVSWNRAAGKWRAQIRINGRQTFLGHFDEASAAAAAYEKSARQHFGEFARLT